MPIKLIIGLRNPGSAYEYTRHNAGGWFAETLAARHDVRFKPEKKMQGELAELLIHNQPCKLVLPLTFMNRSGISARAISQFYRISPNEILIAHDELDLAPGRLKLKTGGGHGGHNGLRDLINQLGSADFHRLRIGIGHPGHKNQVLNYVLGKPSPQDKQLIQEAIERSMDIMPTILAGNMAAAMNSLNG